MNRIILFALMLFPLLSWSATTPLPVFLKSGFSTVLEFEEAPSRVVLGNSQSFLVEKLEKSIVIRTLAPYATGNMFVYFKSKDTQLFILTASEEAEPTYYKKFETIKPPPIPRQIVSRLPLRKGIRILKAQFDAKKDYLIVESEITANSDAPIKPNWDLVRLRYKNNTLSPSKLWSARKEVQPDSKIVSRFVFNKPNLPRDLKGVVLVVPLHGSEQAMRVNL